MQRKIVREGGGRGEKVFQNVWFIRPEWKEDVDILYDVRHRDKFPLVYPDSFLPENGNDKDVTGGRIISINLLEWPIHRRNEP